MSTIERTFYTVIFAAGLAAAPALAQPNPTEAQNAVGRNNPCADPWVSYAVSVAKTVGSSVGRAAGSGSSDECNTALYNDGHWNSYAELVGYARQTRQMLASQNVQFSMVGGAPALTMINPGAGIAAANVAVKAPPGTRIVASGGGNLVASGGGNLVASGGGNLVASGGGNLVASGGGNIKSGYILQGSDDAKLTFRLPTGKQIRIR